MGTEKPREIAVKALQRHAQSGAWVENILEETLGRTTLAPVDRALAQELTFGVVRWKRTLDWIISQKTAGRTQKLTLQILLRIGLYQLFWLDRIPDHAAVHETVQMARERGFGPQSGFVNALLRACLRERSEWEAKLRDLRIKDPGAGYSHPDWLCARWNERWGAEGLRKLLEWNNTPPPLFARINTLRTTPDELIARLQNAGVQFTPKSCSWTEPGLVLELQPPPPLTELDCFKQGHFYIQDPSTLLAVTELDPQPGERVLDLCAAPGGKTTFIAQRIRDKGVVIAEETNLNRRELIRENCKRLGITSVQVSEPQTESRAGNEAAEGSSSEALFDRVLVDAPCSNTGVMRRRVELRWRIVPTEITRLQKLQLELLQRAATRLKPGGTLVYSTCSLEPEENGQVIQEFLRATPQFRLGNERELTPSRDEVDGAFVATLRRG